MKVRALGCRGRLTRELKRHSAAGSKETGRRPPRRMLRVRRIASILAGMVPVSQVTGSSSESPSMTAMSVMCPLPVFASEP